MSVAAIVEVTRMRPSGGDLADDDDATFDQTAAPAAQAFAEQQPQPLNGTLPVDTQVSGVVLRVRGRATVDGGTVTWITSGGRIKWSVGADQGQRQPLTALPKDTTTPDWIETSTIWTAPSGAAWTATAVNALSVWDRVTWSGTAFGEISLDIMELEVVVLGERTVDTAVFRRVGAVDVVRQTGRELTPRLTGHEVVARSTGAVTVARWLGEEST